MMEALLLGGALSLTTVAMHTIGLAALLVVMRRRSSTLKPYRSALRQMIFVVAMVMGLFVIHSAQMWVYAAAYKSLGVFADWETALYYSVSAFTTLGQGDVYIDGPWRIVGSIEAFNGFLLIGWSTAFLFHVLGRLRAAEFEFLDHLRDEAEN